ncbi:MAG: hypothetical protein V7K81_00285 [Nostoc sp.]
MVSIFKPVLDGKRSLKLFLVIDWEQGRLLTRQKYKINCAFNPL